MELIGYIALGIGGWLSLGYLASSYLFAYSQREFPTIADKLRAEDRMTAFIFLPLGLFAVIIVPFSIAFWGVTRGRSLSHGFDFGWPWA